MDEINTNVNKKWSQRFTPTQVIVLGFFVIICIGTFLLQLPISSTTGEFTNFEDAFFTASSAVCVTGLVVVNTLEHWSIFGQIVILMLIQVGGLGFMTVVTIFLVAIGRRITLKERILIQESLNQESLQGMVRLVRGIIFGTLLFEGGCAIILAIRFAFAGYGWRSIYMGIFHSISAFCNAGFDIIGQESLTPFVGDFVVNGVIMFLIIVGGLGFTVWLDVWRVGKGLKNKEYTLRNGLRKLTLHSKLVLTITPLLILTGFIFFLVCEYSNPQTLKPLPFPTKVTASMLQSVTVRTAGFNSISQSGLTYASKLLTILLMFIGGSPCGTAGGIKTVTFGVITATVLSVIRGKNATSVYKKHISFTILQRALAIFSISLTVLIVSTMILTFTERNSSFQFEFLDLLYETTSALGTVGITTGITPHLSLGGKFLIAFVMYLGRLGPISIAIALAHKQLAYQTDIEYPEEKVMVG